MAATLTDYQGHTAAGRGASAHGWSGVAQISKRHHALVVKPMPSNADVKDNGNTRRSTGGSG